LKVLGRWHWIDGLGRVLTLTTMGSSAATVLERSKVDNATANWTIIADLEK
jgi:hypothetical protein